MQSYTGIMCWFEKCQVNKKNMSQVFMSAQAAKWVLHKQTGKDRYAIFY